MDIGRPAVFSDELGKDGIDNYEILEQVASSVISQVYRARCKRGRLKNRLVALKKISLGKSHLPSSLSLYQTLCHPRIVSLFSVFSASSYRFQVLELCSGGSLSVFLACQKYGILGEAETRSVLKSIIDGLAYLKKNCIVHRNINLENVLLTEQCRIKLSNLDLAIRLPSQDFPPIPLLTHPEYIAPEFLSRRPYDYSADLWSLGCVAFTCLVGRPPFQGPSMDDIFENILHGRYTTPETLSALATNLISSLVRVDPASRQDLASMSYDSFFDPRLPDIPLKLSESVPQMKGPKTHHLPYRAPSTFKAKLSGESVRKRPPLQEIQNTDLRRILSDEISPEERRVMSVPYTKSETVVAHDPRRQLSLNLDGVRSHRPKNRAISPDPSDVSEDGIRRSSPKARDKPKIRRDEGSESDSSADPLPVGMSRPLPLDTSLLSARAHKSVNGQITVLPSRSLLVDFREGERRRGKPGTEVFVISPEGKEIKIYSAPHLSTPCCLMEAVTEYGIDTLPREYWAQYNDAASLTGRLKQRTPRMTLYEPTLKCTLMANAPQADIELIFSDLPSNASRKIVQKRADKDKAYMRIWYSRQTQSLEIAQCVVGPQGKEWKKRTFNIPSLDMSSEVALSNLSGVEVEGIKRLTRFTRICEAAEDVEDFPCARDDTCVGQRNISDSKPINNLSPLENPLIDDHPPSTNRVASGSRTLAQSLSMSSVDFAPRPRKFSSVSKGFRDAQDPSVSSKQQSQAFDYSTKATSLIAADITPSWYRDEVCTTDLAVPGQLLQTRHIPSVGWCIRYGSKISQGGRYKVMFLDGEVLDVDVDEEWVEHIVPCVEGSSKRQRRPIRESHLQRTLSERMKVFEEFVSMFDE